MPALTAARGSGATQPAQQASGVSMNQEKRFVERREAITGFVRDAIAGAFDRQKTAADKRGRANNERFVVGEKVLLSTTGIQAASVSNLGSSKLSPRYVGPFTIRRTQGDTYTLDIPSAMRLHPTFYVRRLKRYWPATVPSSELLGSRSTLAPSASSPPTLNAPTPESPALEEAQSAIRGTLASSANSGAEARREMRCCQPGAPSCSTPGCSAASSTPRAPMTAPAHRDSTRQRDLPRPQHSGLPSEDQQPTAPPPLVVRDRHQPELERDSPQASEPAGYVRDGPPPLVDSEGNARWVVDRIVEHRDPGRGTRGAALTSRDPGAISPHSSTVCAGSVIPPPATRRRGVRR